MPEYPREDRDLKPAHLQALAGNDALAELFVYLGYPAETRLPMTPEALGLGDDLRRALTRVERLASVDDGALLLEVYLFELKSITALRARELAHAFRDRVGDFLLVLTTPQYEQLDFALLEREAPGLLSAAGAVRSPAVRLRTLTVERARPDAVALRVLRRFTLTERDAAGNPDAGAQYDKLRSAFTVAEWSEPFFNNRALFSDYYLNERLPDLPEWNAEERNRAFREVRKTFAETRRRLAESPADGRDALIRPLLALLGFRVEPGDGAPDFRLYAGAAPEKTPVAFALAYPWNRYLDGKDENRDPARPNENPGAQVVALLENAAAPWGIVTNGKVWRLYSARAHSRATNYYEIDLEEALASPEPGLAFRYFYLFFRAAAFAPGAGATRAPAFLDRLVEESAAYARQLGERLKERVFEEIFPHFAAGFVNGMGGAEALLALPAAEREAQLQTVFLGTLTFLYRLLFLLYAESRDLLPAREQHGYRQAGLQRLTAEIARIAGPLEDAAPAQLAAAYRDDSTQLYARLSALFALVDRGSPAHNVPVYNGGLFTTQPAPGDMGREARAARFLLATAIPDRALALGLDRLARDVDAKRGDLVCMDYKSLGVRQLGSIYEGLLEFKLAVAAEDMAVVRGKKTEEIAPYAEAQRRKLAVLSEGRGANARERVLPRGAVYLANDRRERKATGSYYTPDYIVKYIVRHTLGPVLDEKFEALRPRLYAAERAYEKTLRRKREMEGVANPDRPALLRAVAGDVLRDLFDVKVLDPAMGSGHFLVEAVDYVTDRLVRFLDGFPCVGDFFAGMRAGILAEMERQQVSVDPARLTDVTLLKRHVLKRCIYGVDLNPMAVELAKVSLWLDCFTLGAPLSFLDHHLRCGNSLIGARARDVDAELRGGDGAQITFLTGPFVGLLRAAEIMRGIGALSDVTLAEVKESGALFKEFDRAATPYKQLLDIYVAQHFGVARAAEFLTLYGADALKADPAGLGKPYREVLAQARALYAEKRFFHWDLEFPEVFIDLERADWKENGGFDAVVGNPPYDELSEDSLGRIIDERDFLKIAPPYAPAKESGGRLNWYHFFMLLGINVLNNAGRCGYIVPMSWLGDSFTSGVRHWLLKEHRPLQIDGFPQKDDPKRRVFPEAKLPTSVFIIQKNRSQGDILVRIHPGRDILEAPFYNVEVEILQKFSPDILIIPVVTPIGWEILKKTITSHKLGRIGKAAAEPTSGEIIFNAATRQYFTDDSSFDLILRGGHIQRYELLDKARQGDPVYLKTAEYLANSQSESKAFDHQHPRIVYQEGSGIDAWRRVIPTYLPAGYICGHKVCYFVNYKIDPFALLAIFGSRLINWLVESLSMTNSLPAYLISNLPFPVFAFTTAPAERARLLAAAQALYAEGMESELRIANGESREANGELRIANRESREANDASRFTFHVSRFTFPALHAFIAARLSADPEQSDVVHDLLAYLAQQMIDLNRQKQAEQQRYLAGLAAQLWPALTPASPPPPSTVYRLPSTLDSLTGKTTLYNYLGDYQKGEAEAPWDAIENVLHKNRTKLGVTLTPALLAALRRDYRASLETLRPLKARLAFTDRLIDGIVYQLYGLTDEEIAVVEGKEKE